MRKPQRDLLSSVKWAGLLQAAFLWQGGKKASERAFLQCDGSWLQSRAFPAKNLLPLFISFSLQTDWKAFYTRIHSQARLQLRGSSSVLAHNPPVYSACLSERETKQTLVVIPADSPVETQQSSSKQPIPSVNYSFFLVFHFIWREKEVSDSSVRLSWFYSKQPPLRKRFKLVSLFSSCWSWSVECISRGGGRVREIRLRQVFYYRPILYRNKMDPRYPSLRRGEEKLRKCQNQWIIFILDENGCVWRMDAPERVRERWISVQ